MRSLLGSDFGPNTVRPSPRICFFEPSPQAGSDVTAESGQVSVQRATRYGANLMLPRTIMEIDRSSDVARACRAAGVDMVVVLVNRPS